MRNSIYKTAPTKTTLTSTTLVVGWLCLLNVFPAQAQNGSSTRQQLAPQVGAIQSERIFKVARPTADKLANSGSATIKQPTVKSKSTLSAKDRAMLEKLINAKKKTIAKIKPIEPVVPQKKTFTKPKLPFSRVSSPTAKISKPATDQTPPTVVVRPPSVGKEHLNQCVVEVNEIKSTNEVSLKVSVPDSVTMIEVIPNRSSNATRNFRIKMEQGVGPSETIHKTPLANRQIDSVERQSQFQTLPMPEQIQPEDNPKPTAENTTLVTYEPVDNLQTSFKNPFLEDTSSQHQPTSETIQTAAVNAKASNSSGASDNNEFPVRPGNLETSNQAAVEPMAKQVYWGQKTGVRDFLHRETRSTPLDLAQQTNTQEPMVEFDSIEPTHSSSADKPVIAAQIVGPSFIDVGQTADFMIAIVNPMESDHRNLEVVLDVPKGIEIVLLSQAADFDERTRKLSWQVDQIRPGEETKLHYRIKSLTSGKQQQRVAIRHNQELLEQHQITTIADLVRVAEGFESRLR